MNYKEYMANIKAYRNGTLMQAAPTDALSDWHEKYFDTAVSALSKKMIADHVEHSEDADKFGKDFVSLVAILEEDGVSKQDIGKELEAVSKAAQSKADAAIKKIDSVQHSTDTFEGYQAAIKAYKENHLEHAEWKKHKYIRIENGRYIYPDDLKKTNNTSRNNQVPLNKQISNKIGSTLSNLTPKKTTTAPTSPARTDQISGEKYVENKLKDIATGLKNIGSAVKEHRSEAEAKKAAAEAMKAGRAATQQYKESGQYERDVADEKAKRETMARQDEAKKITSMTPEEARKRAAELTKQNTPESKSKVLENDVLKYAKKGSSTYDKAMKEVNEILSKNPNAEVEVSLGENKNGVDMSGYLHLYEKSANKDGSGKGTYIPLKDDAKNSSDHPDGSKPVSLYSDIPDVPAGLEKYYKKTDSESKNEEAKAAAKKQRDQIEKDLNELVPKTDYGYLLKKSFDDVMSEADKLLKDDPMGMLSIKLDQDKNGALSQAQLTIDHGDRKGSQKSTTVYVPLNGTVKPGDLPEWQYKKVVEGKARDAGRKATEEYKKKVQHSDPRAAFYAAVDEYKSKKGLDQRVPL